MDNECKIVHVIVATCGGECMNFFMEVQEMRKLWIPFTDLPFGLSRSSRRDSSSPSPARRLSM